MITITEDTAAQEIITIGRETHFSLSLGLHMQDQGVAYTLVFKDGKIAETKQGEDKDTLVMAGSRAAWCAICNGSMDPFAASIQKKWSSEHAYAIFRRGILFSVLSLHCGRLFPLLRD